MFINAIRYNNNKTGICESCGCSQFTCLLLQHLRSIYISKSTRQSIVLICVDNSNKNSTTFTATNRMNPGIVMIELRDLTYIEQLLIAKVQRVIRVYRLYSEIKRIVRVQTIRIQNKSHEQWSRYYSEIVNRSPQKPTALSIITIVIRYLYRAQWYSYKTSLNSCSSSSFEI